MLRTTDIRKLRFSHFEPTRPGFLLHLWAFVLFGTILFAFSSCDPWELEPANFPEVMTLSTVELGNNPTELRVSGQIMGLLDGASVENHGHIWSASVANPTLETRDGQTQLNRIGNGEFQSVFKDLTPGRRIYFRAYVVFDQEVLYGSVENTSPGELNFRIRPDTVIGITRTKANSNIVFQNILSDLPQQLTIKAYGTTWATQPDPDVDRDDFTIDGQNFLNSESRITYQSRLVNVPPGRYYLRPYLQIADTVYYGENYCLSLGDFWVRWSDFPDRDCGSLAFSIDGLGYYGNGEIVVQGASFFELCLDQWVYRPQEDTWTPYGSTLSSSRNEPRVFEINNKIYAGWGYRRKLGSDQFSYNPHFKDLHAFRPESGSWEGNTLEMPGRARSGMIAFAIGNYLYAGCGTELNEEDGPNVDHQDFWKFDPESGQGWIQIKDFPEGHRAGGASFALNGKGYWINGSEFWEYLPNTDEWRPKVYPHKLTGSPRFYFIINGKAYLVAGGFWEYEPGNEGWTQVSGSPMGLGPSFVIDDIAYTITAGATWAYYPLIPCE